MWIEAIRPNPQIQSAALDANVSTSVGARMTARIKGMRANMEE
jgi:hypothetical protein